MRAALLGSLALLLAPALFGPASAGPNYDRWALYVRDGHAGGAWFTYDGPCNGRGVLTVTHGGPSGVQTRSAAVTSSSPTNTCGAALACAAVCPGVPTAYAWTLSANDVFLAGGGPSYLDDGEDEALVCVMTGNFLGGHLTAYGIWY